MKGVFPFLSPFNILVYFYCIQNKCSVYLKILRNLYGMSPFIVFSNNDVVFCLSTSAKVDCLLFLHQGVIFCACLGNKGIFPYFSKRKNAGTHNGYRRTLIFIIVLHLYQSHFDTNRKISSVYAQVFRCHHRAR